MALRGNLKSLAVRPALPVDDARIVEIYNLQEPDSMPLTLDRFREQRVKGATNHQSEHYVAENESQALGYGSFYSAWWTGQTGIYALEIRVDSRHARQGIGTRLYALMRSRLVLKEATRLLVWVRSDSEAGREFAAHLRFHPTGQIIQEYRLNVSEANIGAFPDAEERLARSGIRIARLSELPGENTEFLRALQRLWANSGDEPSGESRLCNSFESWRQEVLHAPGLSPDTHWIALDGERPVGMTFLKQLSENAYENDYTGVAAAHRGRGIATALKRQTIIWAQQEGVQSFYTSSEVGNNAMIAINTRLGYLPGAQRLEFACQLP